MATSYVCPYFKRIRDGKIICEAVTVKLPDKATLDEFAGKHCASENYKACSVCQALDKYYEKKYKGG
jgi:hypothetical protein